MKRGTTHRDLDGHSLVDAVLVVQVDAVDAQPLEAALARRPDVRRVAADLSLAVGERDAELGSQLHLVPHPALQRLLAVAGISSSTFSVQNQRHRDQPEIRKLGRKRTLPRRISLVWGP
jgi:hypothetical protein